VQTSYEATSNATATAKQKIDKIVDDLVGLHKFNPLVTLSLKPPGFNP
jgi:hypothetical protein